MPVYNPPTLPSSNVPLTAVTANTTFVVPAGWAIDDIFIINTTAARDN